MQQPESIKRNFSLLWFNALTFCQNLGKIPQLWNEVLMSGANETRLSSSVVQAIQDAILLGNSNDLEGVIELLKFDEDFPPHVRYGLEALLHFRRYYGKGGELEPKNKVEKGRLVQMEVVWGRELIESLARHINPAHKRFAQV
jgi:hypothetical protein